MAAVLNPDWISDMDLSSNNSRQRSSPANDPNPPHPPQHPQHPQSPPYTFPIQQQPQGSWTPSIAAAPFYPTFFQGQQQPAQPYPGQLPPQAAYFDPANAQLAQWAYQQMMFNAQHGFPQMPPPQRTGSTSSNPGDYFQGPFNPFPSGTPPPHAQRSQSADPHQKPAQNSQYPGFHPYRRPNRQHTPDSSRPGNSHIPQPPYARPDASASTSSVNSSSSGRPRTNSNQSGHSGHNVPSANSISRARNNGSPNPSSSSSSARTPTSPPSQSPASTPKANPQRLPHNRNASSTSSSSSSRPSMLSQPAPTTSTSSATSTSTHRLARPSPLSQGSSFTASEKRMSRDDSDIAAMLESTSKASSGMSRGGLKGRLRRALSFNALKEEEDNDDGDDESIKASNYASTPKAKAKESLTINSGVARPEAAGGIRSPDSGLDDTESTATIQTKKKSRAASLFNSRLNASTDNISLSSTVSSASVMIRKLGSMSKLVVRRNSLAGITSIFKDKNKDGDKTKKKDKKGAKTAAVQAEISHVHAELDRTIVVDANGLSPAAELARQHTLKTRAEAAAKAKAQQEAQAAAAASTNGATNGSNAGVPTWDKNTTTRAGTASPTKRSGGVRVNEDGTRAAVGSDDEDSDEDDPHTNNSYNMDGWDDDEDWDVPEDEDVTIRMDMTKARISEEQDDHEPWAVDLRRSVERSRRPMRGILKNAGLYSQSQYYNSQPMPARARSNSYNSHPGQTELGPLARIPSPDPDHIDGLHRHNSHSSGHSASAAVAAPTIPPLRFESSSPISSNFNTNTKDLPDTPPPERPSSIFQHPALNSSAPALSMVPSTAPTLTHRSATVPAKKLAFATSLSVYDTFSATVYDRRSEPATWSRLTPALAQRIKEELNSYKMEEMEVHAASRIHTQFFV